MVFQMEAEIIGINWILSGEILSPELIMSNHRITLEYSKAKMLGKGSIIKLSLGKFDIILSIPLQIPEFFTTEERNNELYLLSTKLPIMNIYSFEYINALHRLIIDDMYYAAKIPEHCIKCIINEGELILSAKYVCDNNIGIGSKLIYSSNCVIIEEAVGDAPYIDCGYEQEKDSLCVSDDEREEYVFKYRTGEFPAESFYNVPLFPDNEIGIVDKIIWRVDDTLRLSPIVIVGNIELSGYSLSELESFGVEIGKDIQYVNQVIISKNKASSINLVLPTIDYIPIKVVEGVGVYSYYLKHKLATYDSTSEKHNPLDFVRKYYHEKCDRAVIDPASIIVHAGTVTNIEWKFHESICSPIVVLDSGHRFPMDFGTLKYMGINYLAKLEVCNGRIKVLEKSKWELYPPNREGELFRESKGVLYVDKK